MKDSAYLHHMIEATERIESYANGLSKEEFADDTLVQDAVLRQLEILGEATKNLSPEIRERNEDVPWSEIAGMRDTLIHRYFGGIQSRWKSRNCVRSLKVS